MGRMELKVGGSAGVGCARAILLSALLTAAAPAWAQNNAPNPDNGWMLPQVDLQKLAEMEGMARLVNRPRLAEALNEIRSGRPISSEQNAIMIRIITEADEMRRRESVRVSDALEAILVPTARPPRAPGGGGGQAGGGNATGGTAPNPDNGWMLPQVDLQKLAEIEAMARFIGRPRLADAINEIRTGRPISSEQHAAIIRIITEADEIRRRESIRVSEALEPILVPTPRPPRDSNTRNLAGDGGGGSNDGGTGTSSGGGNGQRRLAQSQQQSGADDASQTALVRRYQEAQDRRDRNDRRAERGLETSGFNTRPVTFQPVTFTSPTWTPPVWTPPVWVPPTFRAPDPSQIPWTRFRDSSWPGQTDNLAYQYNNLSGRVATDLSRWNEWLATQNVRELTRLALLAGYPNLAAALADARNLIRQSQDEGYRRWAMQQPSCGGTVGCGPSFLERWWMKQATVSLGDILAASRDIFSTGGFSDIGISGLNLAYLLRDNALQDGDIVRVRISQFGRTLYQGEVNLTNLGERFNQVLRQGVASLEIYAVNEGFSPPNTAQITLDNVTRGNATQSYSLRTGETATLRIETNARGQ